MSVEKEYKRMLMGNPLEPAQVVQYVSPYSVLAAAVDNPLLLLLCDEVE